MKISLWGRFGVAICPVGHVGDSIRELVVLFRPGAIAGKITVSLLPVGNKNSKVLREYPVLEGAFGFMVEIRTRIRDFVYLQLPLGYKDAKVFSEDAGHQTAFTTIITVAVTLIAVCKRRRTPAVGVISVVHVFPEIRILPGIVRVIGQTGLFLKIQIECPMHRTV